MRKFIFSPDKHIGWERKNGKLVPLHNQAAINAMLEFARDFKPDVWIEGGDNLDCGPVSHWLKDKKISSQQLDLTKDTTYYTKNILQPINSIMNHNGERIWMKGNHEDWLDQLAELHPGLESLLDVKHLLNLEGWHVIPSGCHYNVGKLHFIHGDTIKGGQSVAAAAASKYGDHPLRFGHFHTYQTVTRYSMFDSKQAKTYTAVPALCAKNPNYLRNAPSSWLTGFNYGYIHADGTFTDYVPIIVNGKFSAEGRTYKG